MPKYERAVVVSLASAGLLLTIAALFAWMAFDNYDSYVNHERSYLLAQSEADRALRTAREELELGQRVTRRYQELAAGGMFTGVNKPVAIDRAESILRPYAAAVTHYQIGGGHEMAVSPLEKTSQMQIDIQRVAIEFEPLHEGRFLEVWRAIAGLRGPVGGIESCEINRPQEASAEEKARLASLGDVPAVALKARCLLTWYRLPAAAPGATSGAGAAPSAPMLLGPAPGPHGAS